MNRDVGFIIFCEWFEKSNITKQKRTPKKFQNRKYVIKWQNETLKYIKRTDYNSLISDFVQAFSLYKMVGLIWLPNSCMKVA